MEQKTARLTLLIDPNKKAAFERLCAQQDLTASQVIRRLIRDYLAQHGVQYVPSGVATDKAEAKGKERPPVGASSRRDAAPPAKRRTTRRGA
ncbi:ribbon-helix-helix protein, CopG family [Cupriavidus necator]|uniref:ribbon-helix-helix protein, CopG family n=1 Tax=Cupriavidus necator TaxID=106590 RepID=UPI003F739B0B